MKTNINAILWEVKTGVVKTKQSTYTVLYKSGSKKQYTANNITELPQPVQKFINCSIALEEYFITTIDKTTPYTVKLSIIFKIPEVNL